MKNAFNKLVDKIKNWSKGVDWKNVYDKFTTGLLILLMASPLLVFLYIVLWFVL